MTDDVGERRQAAFGIAFFAAILLLDPQTRAVAVAYPGLVISVLLLTATVGLLTQRMSLSPAVAVLALFTLSPLWAAPAVEAAGNPAWLTDAIVASSPLTLIATAMDLDYLRTSWFYANSALGSMRYAYPGWISACVILSLLPLAALISIVLRSTDFTSLRFAKEAHP